MEYLRKKKYWNNLTQVKEYLEKNTKQRVEYFDGALLVTNKHRYGIFDGRLSVDGKYLHD